jgi:hypothetical protein
MVLFKLALSLFIVMSFELLRVGCLSVGSVVLFFALFFIISFLN